MRAPNLPKIQPMGDGEHEATEHADCDLDGGRPSRMSPKRRRRKHADAARPEQYDPNVPVRVQAEPEAEDARRHDEPQHEAVEVRLCAQRDRYYGQDGNEHGDRETVDEAYAGQGDRDLIEKMSRQDHCGMGQRYGGRAYRSSRRDRLFCG